METIIPGIGLFVAVAALIYQSYLTHQQLRLSFYADYTKRYQDIMLQLPTNINNSDFSIASLEEKERETILRYMRTYFDMCSEQYYLCNGGQRKYFPLTDIKGRISKHVWKEWSEGIIHTMDKKAFQEAWILLNIDTGFYPDFSKWVEKLMTANKKKG